MLKKYSPIATLERFSKATARSLNDLSGKLAVICDTDGVLHASGEGKKDLDGKKLSPEMDNILKERRS
jgi:AbrB family transcriptional regulator (stage V sporulation protein T)